MDIYTVLLWTLVVLLSPWWGAIAMVLLVFAIGLPIVGLLRLTGN